MQSLPSGTRIGLDGTLYEISIIQSLQAQLAPKDIHLVFLSSNLVDVIWTDRPAASTAPLSLQAQYAGESSSSKLSTLRKFIADNGGAAYVVSNLAEIAWLLNLRGGDIPFSPVFESYILVSATETTLFIDEVKLTDEVVRYLNEEGKVQTKPYDRIWDALSQLKAEYKRCIMSTEASFALYNAVGAVSVACSQV